MDVEKKIADMVPKEYEVNLTNPELTILVVVAGGSAMMSVVKGYGANEKFHHFRIHSVAELNRTKSGSQPSSPVAKAARQRRENANRTRRSISPSWCSRLEPSTS